MIVLHFWSNTLVIWPGQVLGIGMIVAMVWLFWKAQKDPTNPLNFATMFVWPITGQTSLILFMAFIGGAMGTWIVADREFRGTLTTEMFATYLGILIFGKGATEAINAWGSKAPTPPPPPAQQQIVGTAGAVNMPPAAQPAPPVTPAPEPEPAPAPPPPKKRKRKTKR